jgi:prefoldin subunit 5
MAEAKYKKTITEIESKDKQYDQDLKDLDTEHTALQTEYDSIKEVISKNVDRSFKAFS